MMAAPGRTPTRLICLLLPLWLTACGDGLDNGQILSGTLTGLQPATSVTLQNKGGDDLVLSANGRFEFATPLQYGSSYEVTILTRSDELDCVLANTKGIVLHERIDDITVDCVSWKIATRISDEYGSYTNPAMDRASNGDAFVAWTGINEPRTRIWVNHYVAGRGWGEAVKINQTRGAGPAVATNDRGEAIVVWSAGMDNTAFDIWFSRYSADTGWSLAEMIGPDIGGSSVDPVIAMDANGNALVVWTRKSRQGNGHTLWSAAYAVGFGWSAPEQIDTGGDAPSIGAVAMEQDENGQAVIVWTRAQGGLHSLWSNTYSGAGGWSSPTALARNVTGGKERPALAMNAAGEAMTVWSESITADDGTVSIALRSMRFSFAAGWFDASSVNTADWGDVAVPELGIDRDGNALTAWRQTAMPGTAVGLAPFVAAGAWGEPLTTAVEGCLFVRLAVNNGGDAVILWDSRDPTGVTRNMHLSQYNSTAGWGAPVVVQSRVNFAGVPLLALTNDGHVMMVWAHNTDTSSEILAARYLFPAGS